MTTTGSKRVSVVITAHNYAEYLPACLDSALDQTFPADKYEIVVVDDGSNDETPEILREYRYEFPERIQTVRLDGCGLPAACNEGIATAAGEYIIRLDADDFFDENILTVEAEYLNAHPDIDLVYPDYYTVDHGGDIIDHVRNPEVGSEVKLLNRSPLAAGAMYRRDAWEALGGYDEAQDYQEDYDFWIRFIDDFAVHNVNLPLMYYRRHDSNMTHDVKGHLEARNEVKREFVDNHLDDELASTEVLCLIPAMAESRIEAPDAPDDGSPLALRTLQGRSLLSYTVTEALAADRVDWLHVSTEDERIAEAARDLGAEVPFLRPEELSSPTVGLHEVVKNHLDQLREREGYEPDLVVLNQYISPLKTASHVDATVDTFLMFSVDSVITVCKTNDFFWQPAKFGLSPLFEKRLLREEMETLYRENGALYAFSPDVVAHRGDIIGDHVGHLQLDRRNAVHIDSLYDYKLCEYLLSRDGSDLYPDYRANDLAGEAGQ